VSLVHLHAHHGAWAEHAQERARAPAPPNQPHTRHCFGRRLADGPASPAQVRNVGFTTHTGTVAAAKEWGEPVQRMAVKPSIPGLRPLAACGVGGSRGLPYM